MTVDPHLAGLAADEAYECLTLRRDRLGSRRRDRLERLDVQHRPVESPGRLEGSVDEHGPDPRRCPVAAGPCGPRVRSAAGPGATGARCRTRGGTATAPRRPAPAAARRAGRRARHRRRTETLAATAAAGRQPRGVGSGHTRSGRLGRLPGRRRSDSAAPSGRARDGDRAADPARTRSSSAPEVRSDPTRPAAAPASTTTAGAPRAPASRRRLPATAPRRPRAARLGSEGEPRRAPGRTPSPVPHRRRPRSARDSGRVPAGSTGARPARRGR